MRGNADRAIWMIGTKRLTLLQKLKIIVSGVKKAFLSRLQWLILKATSAIEHGKKRYSDSRFVSRGDQPL